MKNRIARLLFAYLCRMGLVLCVTDPGVVGDGGGDPPGDGDAGGDAGSDAGDAGNPGDDLSGDEGGNDGDAQAAADGTKKPPLTEEQKRIAKLERRIGTRTRALGAKDEENAELRRQLAALRSGQPAATRDTPAAGGDGGDDGVETRARQLARQMVSEETRAATIAGKTRAMLDAGKAIPGFRELALEVAKDLPFIDPETRAATPFIEAVLECPNPHEVLVHIERNDLAGDLRDLTPIQLGFKLAAIFRDAKALEKKHSNAARVLDPITPRGNASNDGQNLTDEQWRAQHFKQRTKV